MNLTEVELMAVTAFSFFETQLARILAFIVAVLWGYWVVVSQ